MASMKKPESNRSRRNFIKTATTVTAAASVGIMSGVASCNTAPSPWGITGRQLQTFWTKIHPKLVALSWNDQSYRAQFESDLDFRRLEAVRIARILGVRYTSDINILIPNDNPETNTEFLQNAMPRLAQRLAEMANERELEIPCFSNIYGDTFFLINECGIIIPWPAPPDRLEACIAYNQGSGVLPRSGPQWYSSQSGPEYDLYEDLSERNGTPRHPGGWEQSVQQSSGTGPSSFPTEGLSGVALLSLFERWPRMIALAWFNEVRPGGGTDTRDDMDTGPYSPQKYILPEVWSEWPQEHVEADIINGKDDFEIEYDSQISNKIRMQVPLPHLPVDDENIYRELIVGYATNPLYTNTY